MNGHGVGRIGMEWKLRGIGKYQHEKVDSKMNWVDCYECDGGMCIECNGKGLIPYADTEPWEWEECERCYGTGSCWDCEGTGMVKDLGNDSVT